ncbi:MAG TPA: TonB-dependent receptor plug domain-containing protein, partial [Rhizomicrobium sp.]|nr:TonB-dependent receptor plug domain-containing protein [Rhizomicrobium sp.]
MIRKFSKAALHGGACCLALICSNGAWAQPKPIDIPAEDAGKSIPELARQAGVQIIAPGQALHGLVTPAVKGEYEVRGALTGMLRGTDLRIAADDGRTIVLAPNPKNVQAAADEAAAGSQGASVEQVVVTGSRVISNIANSPTPLTVVTAEQLQATTPTNIPDALNKLPIFLGSQQPHSAGNGGSGSGQNVLALRFFGAQRTLVLFDNHRVAPDNANGTVNV